MNNFDILVEAKSSAIYHHNCHHKNCGMTTTRHITHCVLALGSIKNKCSLIMFML